MGHSSSLSRRTMCTLQYTGLQSVTVSPTDTDSRLLYPIISNTWLTPMCSDWGRVKKRCSPWDFSVLLYVNAIIQRYNVMDRGVTPKCSYLCIYLFWFDQMRSFSGHDKNSILSALRESPYCTYQREACSFYVAYIVTCRCISGWEWHHIQVTHYTGSGVTYAFKNCTIS